MYISDSLSATEETETTPTKLAGSKNIETPEKDSTNSKPGSYSKKEIPLADPKITETLNKENTKTSSKPNTSSNKIRKNELKRRTENRRLRDTRSSNDDDDDVIANVIRKRKRKGSSMKDKELAYKIPKKTTNKSETTTLKLETAAKEKVAKTLNMLDVLSKMVLTEEQKPQKLEENEVATRRMRDLLTSCKFFIVLYTNEI